MGGALRPSSRRSWSRSSRSSTRTSSCSRCSCGGRRAGAPPSARPRNRPRRWRRSPPNQGLYNGFLAAGLALSLILPEPTAFAFKAFFLACVIIAGVYGAATVSRRILVVQALPAALALIAVVLAR